MISSLSRFFGNTIEEKPFMPTIDPASDGLIALSAEVVSAFVANNSVPVAELAALLGSVHAALV
jgi:predicted transcriptional regulator